MLTGVASTVPALLTAIEQLPPQDYRRQLERISVTPLDAQFLLTAATQRIANRWLMREQLLQSYDYVDRSLDATLRALSLRPNDTFIKRAVSDAQCAVASQRVSDGSPGEALVYYREAYANDPLNLMALIGAVDASLQDGDTASARSLLELASPEQRKTFEHLFYQGFMAMRRGDYGGARKAFERAASHGQESPTLHAYLGVLDLRDGQRDSASAHFERALTIATAPMDALSDVVGICASNGFADVSRPYADRMIDLTTAAIARNPGSPSLYTNRALAYSALGEQSLAARDTDSSRALRGWWGSVEQSAPDGM
jgi:tetratricopeptide (TPR) repeat protein